MPSVVLDVETETVFSVSSSSSNASSNVVDLQSVQSGDCCSQEDNEAGEEVEETKEPDYNNNFIDDYFRKQETLEHENDLNRGYEIWRTLIVAANPPNYATPEEAARASSLRFQKPPVRVPMRSIALATFLCMFGLALFVIGVLIWTGHIDTKFSDRVWPMLMMGLLMFIPGAYHVRIAYCAYKGIPGFSFEDIPEFD